MASTFDPGTGGTLKSTDLPGAFFELARFLDACESARNGANPGITPKQNITVSVDFGTKTAVVAAAIPAAFTIDTAGKLVTDASDYLGTIYSEFKPGGGSLKSTDAPSALVEMAGLLAAAEKAVTPVDDQPNNIQLVIDQETGAITVSATLPITTSTTAGGDVVIAAVDYL